MSGPQKLVGPTLKLSTAIPDPPAAAPPLGRDTDSILREIGYSAPEIETLHKDQIVS